MRWPNNSRSDLKFSKIKKKKKTLVLGWAKLHKIILRFASRKNTNYQRSLLLHTVICVSQICNCERNRNRNPRMAALAAGPDHLFNLRNNFYLGAYQAAINNSELPNLSPDEAVERDCLVFRSYIALGSYQLVINEIDSSAATPLQAVKLLALYLSGPDYKVRSLWIYALCLASSSSSLVGFDTIELNWILCAMYAAGIGDLQSKGVVGGSGHREQPYSQADCRDYIYVWTGLQWSSQVHPCRRQFGTVRLLITFFDKAIHIHFHILHWRRKI